MFKFLATTEKQNLGIRTAQLNSAGKANENQTRVKLQFAIRLYMNNLS